MKTFLPKKKPDVSLREAAQGSLTANLAVPGMGSVVAGRKVGYVQLVIYFCGFGLTAFFGFRFVLWAFTHWSELYAEFHDPDSDPIAALSDLWHRTRWAFLGITLFAISWFWALSTSRTLLAEAKTNAERNTPPAL